MHTNIGIFGERATGINWYLSGTLLAQGSGIVGAGTLEFRERF